MKICRYVMRDPTSMPSLPPYGLIEGENVNEISGPPWGSWSRNSLSFVLGYTCLNDVTARDLQKSDVQFTRAKGFDTFCAVGPHIETALDPSNLVVETHVNGVRRQSGSTSLMIYPPAFLVRWISRMMTLMPGDVIATGTPAGVGPLVAGDTVEVSVAGVGVLRNPVQGSQA